MKRVQDRVFPRLSVDPCTGCWLWLGATRRGYGAFTLARKSAPVHRWVWEHFRGPIPPGLVVDHLCRVRHCANPDHLDLVTRKVNALRGMSPAIVTHRANRCQQGHDLSDAYIAGGRQPGRRNCLTCSKARIETPEQVAARAQRDRERYQRLRAARVGTDGPA